VLPRSGVLAALAAAAAAGAATGIAAGSCGHRRACGIAGRFENDDDRAFGNLFAEGLTRISLTTPAADDGTSIVALSDSRVTRASSTLTTSPTMTQMSITGTSV
jgi:hypothetical protein